MKIAFRSAPFLSIASLLVGHLAWADPSPASLFTDGAVLQRDKPVPIWGKADAGEKIVVTFAGQKQETITGMNGRWRVLLDALPASTTGTELTLAGKTTLTVRDVVVGEVWLCSGQSNMEFAVSRAHQADREIAAAHFPLLRHVKIEHAVTESPADGVKTSGWKPATLENVGGFTAVGYFFARDLQQKLGVPIGIVHSSWGGTPVESWMSATALATHDAFKVVGARWQQNLAGYAANKATYEQWTRDEAAAKIRGKPAHQAFLKVQPRPPLPRGPGDPWTPMGLFNGMIHPLAPYALRGFLWYQGENNTERAAEYRALFGAMITDWRAQFGQGDAPFFWVNLASFQAATDTTGRNYAFLREAQTQTLALPHTGQALAIDIGEAKDIHPKNKLDVGRRLALLAKNRVYGMVCDDTGPTFAGITREGAILRVSFENAGGGLVAHDTPPRSLELAGADKVFHPATGRIERGTLVVRSPAVKDPVAVRYAWQNAPEANLFIGSGLPAVPFRSDNW